jgi:polyisoprenoid-binding protein YceI
MTWQLDDIHSQIGFSVKHMMVSTVRGRFKSYRGALAIDPADFARSTFEGEIDVASVDTGNAQRDDHLRTGDFFDAANHPTIRFKSTGIEPSGGGEYVVRGDLTMRGVTRPVELQVEFHGTSKNHHGKTVAGITARGAIHRKDFGVNYNALLEAGGVAISEVVKVEIDAEAVADEASRAA